MHTTTNAGKRAAHNKVKRAAAAADLLDRAWAKFSAERAEEMAEMAGYFPELAQLVEAGYKAGFVDGLTDAGTATNDMIRDLQKIAKGEQ